MPKFTMRDRQFAMVLSLIAAIWLFSRPPAVTAQSTGYVIPNPKFYAADNNGLPCAGCFLYTYSAGTTTPATTYSDSGLTVPNSDPITLDSAGRATIYIP